MEGLQYCAETVREIFFGQVTRLAQLSYTNDDVRASGELIHHCFPFFLALLHFLYKRTMLTPETY
jgi:hypothetical protein